MFKIEMRWRQERRLSAKKYISSDYGYKIIPLHSYLRQKR